MSGTLDKTEPGKVASSGGGQDGDNASNNNEKADANRRYNGAMAAGNEPATTAVAASNATQEAPQSENRRPVSATLSEEHTAASEGQQPKQMLRSKFASRTDTDTGGVPSDPIATTASQSIHETDCDNVNTTSTTTTTKITKDAQQQLHDLNKSSITMLAQKEEVLKASKLYDDDANDQVVPEWPSRSDVAASQAISNQASIQHQVYSLKDYSQVANPSVVAMAAQNAATSVNSSGKLLKSMSQDRKVKSSTKRLSECTHLAGANQSTGSGRSAPKGAAASSKQRNPSLTMASTGSSQGGPVDQQTPLIATQVTSTTRHAALLSESRMDRMRKLFVSPLSLRSGSAAGSSGAHASTSSGGGGSSKMIFSSSSSTDAAQRGATANPRLSLQSNASALLNEPHHHLMHAMYRTRGAHRRSPMRQKVRGNKNFRIYGCPLHMANNIYPITYFGRPDIYKQQAVPYILARLCNYIEENSSQLTHEGIFRVSGNARLMEKLRTLFDHLGDAPLESESVDVATSASMLKMYLRELPEPLIPTRLNYHFIALAKKYSSFLAKDMVTSSGSVSNLATSNVVSAMAITSSSTSNIYKRQQRQSLDQPTSDILNDSKGSLERHRVAFLRDLTKLIRKLPIDNYNLLKYLACFLYRISLKQNYNKMCAEALGIVFGPNVFRIRSESYKGLKEQELSNQIMAGIIGNYKLIFDSELTDPLGNIVENVEDGEKDKVPSKVAGKQTKQSSSSGADIATTSTAMGSEMSVSNTSIPEPSMDSTGFNAMVHSATQSESDIAGNQTNRLSNQLAIPEAQSVSSNVNDGDDEADEEEEIEHDDEEDVDDGEGHVHACCAKHCPDYIFVSLDRHQKHHHHHRRNHTIDGNANANRDEDDVDACDEDDDDESYTPSGESDSYCSSMDSDTMESSFDGTEGYHGEAEPDDEEDNVINHGGEGDNEDEDVDNEEDEIAGIVPRSLNRCASDTSYTPSSSHSESVRNHDDDDDDAAEDDGDDESLGGHLNSSGRAADEGSSTTTNANTRNAPGPDISCQVCKRRESAQMNQASLINKNKSRTCDNRSDSARNPHIPAAATAIARSSAKSPSSEGQSEQSTTTSTGTITTATATTTTATVTTQDSQLT